jgi:methyl-accepting chemotaxis protein
LSNFVSRFLGNLRVGAKLGLLGGLAVVGFLFVCGVLVYQDSELSSARELRQTADKRADNLADFALELLQARRHEKDFLLRRTAASVDAHATTMAKIQKTLAEIRVGAAPELAEEYRKIEAGLAAYNEAFAVLVRTVREIGVTENDGLQGRMRTAVRAAEAELLKLEADRITVGVLQLRRNEKDFQLRETQAEADTHARNTASLLTLLAQSGLAAAQTQALTGLVDSYGASFKSLVAGTAQKNAQVSALSSAYAAIEPIINAAGAAEERAHLAFEARIEQRLAVLRNVVFGTVAAISALVVLLTIAIATAITKSMVSISTEMGRLGTGETDLSVDTSGKDEIADMARSLLVFRDNLVKQRALEAAADERQAAELARTKKIAEATDFFSKKVASLVDATGASVEGLRTTSDELTRISATALDLSVSAASGANEASTNVQTVAAAAEQLTASIGEISRQIVASSQSADQTADLAKQSEEKVRKLSEVARKIDSVVTLINAIASQTNLLALNATIEAARAGEAGKGFAVVASEVKQLASQTAKATSDIAEQVQEIQSQTDGVVEAMSRIGESVLAISQMTAAVSAAIEEQTAATKEIGRNVAQAAAGVEETNRSITGVRQAAERTGTSSTDVLSASKDVGVQTADLASEIQAFLEKVKAA